MWVFYFIAFVREFLTICKSEGGSCNLLTEAVLGLFVRKYINVKISFQVTICYFDISDVI
jgi:hypothetical protein